VEQPQVELIVRLTARASATLFAAALILFAIGPRPGRRGVRYAIRLFLGFVLAHTIHFSAVVWLAVLTAGENIQERDGWTVVLAVGALFYFAAFLIVRAWRGIDSGRMLPRRDGVAANAAITSIALAFLNSYLSRVPDKPIYWLPAICLVASVAVYFVRMRALANPVREAAASPS
jgi:hypothetical protein